MNRRAFLQKAVVLSLSAGIAGKAGATSYFFPASVDHTLFEGINRVKNQSKKTGLEKGHAPVITSPSSVKAGEPFLVEIAVGENIHPMGPNHWIEYIELSIGNEPAGRADFQPRGFMSPKVAFSLIIPKDIAVSGRVTLAARQRCNLHGLWEGSFDIMVS